MLMSNTARAARLHYMANGFRVLAPGDHVVCAVSGERIPLDSCATGASSARNPMPAPRIAAEAIHGK